MAERCSSTIVGNASSVSLSGARSTCTLPLAEPPDEVPLYMRWEQFLPTVENVRFVQVGANCGANTAACSAGGDPIWRYAAQCGWRGVAIEPVQRTFDQLCANYARLSPRVTPLRALVSDAAKSDGLVIADPKYSELNRAPTESERAHYLSAVSNGSGHGDGAQHHSGRKRQVPKVERVPTVLLRDVWPRGVPRHVPLVLVIDAEGYEPTLLGRSTSLPRPPPDAILFEAVHLTADDRGSIDANLRRQGYARRGMLKHMDAVARRSNKVHDWLYMRTNYTSSRRQ